MNRVEAIICKKEDSEINGDVKVTTTDPWADRLEHAFPMPIIPPYSPIFFCYTCADRIWAPAMQGQEWKIEPFFR